MPQLEHIEAIEKRLWSAADTLRANSNYASNEYFLPVMGLVFLRHAYGRYLGVKGDIEANLPKRGGKTQALSKEWLVHLRFPGHEHAKTKAGVPLGWTRPSLGEVINLKRGYDLPTGTRKPGTVPVVSSSGITGFHDTAKAKAPGVVTGRYVTLGEVYLIQEDFWPLNTALYVQDFKGNDRYFTFHLLADVLPGTSSDKAAVPGVNRNDLHRMEIMHPPGHLQRLFAETVSPLHKQVTILEDQLSKLSEARDLLLPRLMNGEIAV